CELAVAVREALVKENSQTPAYRHGLAENYLNRGLARRALGDPAGAAADLRRALALYDGLEARGGGPGFLFAWSHPALRGSGGAGRAAGAGSEAEAAMALLRVAVGGGYRSHAFYRHEDALDPLRGRDDFRLLMLDLAMPADPFAR